MKKSCVVSPRKNRDFLKYQSNLSIERSTFSLPRLSCSRQMGGIFMALSLLFLGSESLAKEKKITADCAAFYLNLKKCELRLDSYWVQVNQRRIIVHDGTWRRVHDFVMPDEGTQWQSLRLRKINSRTLLEMLIWGPSKGEAQIQNLHWMIGELVQSSFTLRLDKVVQKRRGPKDSGEEGTDKSPLTEKPFYFELKKMEDGKVKWRVNHESGTF